MPNFSSPYFFAFQVTEERGPDAGDDSGVCGGLVESIPVFSQ